MTGQTLMLAISGVHAFYGNIEALRGVDLEVGAGEIVALIGANGAGKSTLLMTVCGRPRAARGRVLFDGRDLTRLETFEIVRRGIAQVPEGRRIFPRMTVLENLQIGATSADPACFDEDLARVFGLFPILQQRQGQRGGTLSGGEQQMLAIARAMMLEPKIILLDEPTAGMSHSETEYAVALIRRVTQRKTLVMVEHDMRVVFDLADTITVLVYGQVVASGPPAEIRANRAVQEAYLGALAA